MAGPGRQEMRGAKIGKITTLSAVGGAHIGYLGYRTFVAGHTSVLASTRAPGFRYTTEDVLHRITDLLFFS